MEESRSGSSDSRMARDRRNPRYGDRAEGRVLSSQSSHAAAGGRAPLQAAERNRGRLGGADMVGRGGVASVSALGRQEDSELVADPDVGRADLDTARDLGYGKRGFLGLHRLVGRALWAADRLRARGRIEGGGAPAVRSTAASWSPFQTWTRREVPAAKRAASTGTRSVTPTGAGSPSSRAGSPGTALPPPHPVKATDRTGQSPRTPESQRRRQGCAHRGLTRGPRRASEPRGAGVDARRPPRLRALPSVQRRKRRDDERRRLLLSGCCWRRRLPRPRRRGQDKNRVFPRRWRRPVSRDVSDTARVSSGSGTR